MSANPGGRERESPSARTSNGKLNADGKMAGRMPLMMKKFLKVSNTKTSPRRSTHRCRCYQPPALAESLSEEE